MHISSFLELYCTGMAASLTTFFYIFSICKFILSMASLYGESTDSPAELKYKNQDSVQALLEVDFVIYPA